METFYQQRAKKSFIMWKVSGVYWITDISATIKCETFCKNVSGFNSTQRPSA